MELLQLNLQGFFRLGLGVGQFLGVTGYQSFVFRFPAVAVHEPAYGAEQQRSQPVGGDTQVQARDHGVTGCRDFHPVYQPRRITRPNRPFPMARTV